MTFTYDLNTDAGKVRLLINDVDPGDDHVFENDEITTFLTLSGDSVLLAAAQALDTIADNEALASKVIKTQDLATDGAKLADSLRKRAQSLRDQHTAALEDDGFFQIIEAGPEYPAELTEYGY